MEYLTISQFKALTRLPDPDILSMLELGELSVVKSEAGGCLIDISSLTPDTIARRRLRLAEALDENKVRLAEEALSAELLKQLEPLVLEAMQIALSWHKEPGET